MATAATQAAMADAVYEALDGTLSRAEIKAVLDSYKLTVQGEIRDGQPVNILGLVKVNVKYIPAKPKRKGINPFNPDAGEQWFPAKPESFGVKATALAGLKTWLPSARTAKGREIIAELIKPVRKKAPAKKAAVKKGRK